MDKAIAARMARYGKRNIEGVYAMLFRYLEPFIIMVLFTIAKDVTTQYNVNAFFVAQPQVVSESGHQTLVTEQFICKMHMQLTYGIIPYIQHRIG